MNLALLAKFVNSALIKTFMEVNGIRQLSRFHCIINYGTQIVSLKKSQSAANIWNFPCNQWTHWGKWVLILIFCFLTNFDNFWWIFTTFSKKNELVKSLEVKGVSAEGHFCWETNYPWRPLEAKSDFATVFIWTSQSFWPEKCPGQVSRGIGYERRWTFLLRNKHSWRPLQAKSDFATMFLIWPSILARNMPWSGL